MSIKDRKKDHVDLTTSGEVEYQIPAGFEKYYFAHNALPEVNVDEVSTDVTLLGRTFSFPLFISSMTGGYTDAGAVNAIIAEFCEEHNLPFGVGSQRVMLEEPETTSSFSIVREKAPNAFIASNIGGAQLVGGLSKKKLNLLVDSIEADAVIVHLNPLQELMQPEGDRDFKGIEKGITKLCRDTSLPVIAKETGAGISAEVGKRLLDAGVKVIDVAGAGGTSWAKVENERPSNENPDADFNEWGIPTLECVTQLAALKGEYHFELIASGGIRSSHDIAKSLCLGADFAASAQPVIKAVVENGYGELEQLYQKWNKQLAVILALLGCKTPAELAPSHLKLKR
jgi:isopentenyl-diphosphate delta-isomerase